MVDAVCGVLGLERKYAGAFLADFIGMYIVNAASMQQSERQPRYITSVLSLPSFRSGPGEQS